MLACYCETSECKQCVENSVNEMLLQWQRRAHIEYRGQVAAATADVRLYVQP